MGKEIHIDSSEIQWRPTERAQETRLTLVPTNIETVYSLWRTTKIKQLRYININISYFLEQQKSNNLDTTSHHFSRTNFSRLYLSLSHGPFHLPLSQISKISKKSIYFLKQWSKDILQTITWVRCPWNRCPRLTRNPSKNFKVLSFHTHLHHQPPEDTAPESPPTSTSRNNSVSSRITQQRQNP